MTPAPPSDRPTPPAPENIAQSGTALFIRRPILAFVINALIMLAGLAAFMGADVRELPSVDRAVVTVSTNFSGAAPETIDREITAVIEGAAGRVPGVSSISSVSRFGASRVTVEFRSGTNLDVAATDLREAVSRVVNNLPDAADAPRVIKADADSNAIMRVAMTSSRRSAEDLTRLFQDLAESRLLSAPGVADVQLSGDRNLIFRVDIDMMQLAARGLTLKSGSAVSLPMGFITPRGAPAHRGSRCRGRSGALSDRWRSRPRYRRDGMPESGRARIPARRRETRRCAPTNGSARPTGRNGLDITDEAVSRCEEDQKTVQWTVFQTIG